MYQEDWEGRPTPTQQTLPFTHGRVLTRGYFSTLSPISTLGHPQTDEFR